MTMGLGKFCSIIAVWLGFFGAIFLSKGILKLTPDVMAKISMIFLNYNKEQLKNISGQKADFVCGIICILMAFGIQLTTLLFDFEDVGIFQDYWRAMGVSSLIAVLIFLIVYRANITLFVRYEKSGREGIARHILRVDLMDLRNKQQKSTVTYASVANYAKRYCDFNILPDETFGDFLMRYARYLRVEIPKAIHIKELQNK